MVTHIEDMLVECPNCNQIFVEYSLPHYQEMVQLEKLNCPKCRYQIVFEHLITAKDGVFEMKQ